MRLPWISRAAFDAINEARLALLDERTYLREQLAKALDHTRRLERKEAGLPEVVKEPKPAVVVPTRLVGIVRKFGTPIIQEDQMARVKRAYADLLAEGKSSEEAEQEIEGFLLAKLNEGV